MGEFLIVYTNIFYILRFFEKNILICIFFFKKNYLGSSLPNLYNVCEKNKIFLKLKSPDQNLVDILRQRVSQLEGENKALKENHELSTIIIKQSISSSRQHF